MTEEALREEEPASGRARASMIMQHARAVKERKDDYESRHGPLVVPIVSSGSMLYFDDAVSRTPGQSAEQANQRNDHEERLAGTEDVAELHEDE